MISVIIPIYNTQDYLKRCLNSIINQTFKTLEIICVNANSKDNSLEILKEYQLNDKRIKIINLKEENGVSYARNKAIELAQGDYFSFIDSDDYIDLNFYEELYKIAKLNNSDIVKGNRKTINLKRKVQNSNLNHEIIKNKNKFLFTHEWTCAIYKKELIVDNNIKFEEKCLTSEDTLFLFECLLKSKRLDITNNTSYIYVRRKNSLNSYKINYQYILSALEAIHLILKKLNESELYQTDFNLYIKTYLHHFNSVFYILYRNDDFKTKEICAKKLIEFFYECKNKEELYKRFILYDLRKIIKNKEQDRLSKKLSTYNLKLKLPLFKCVHKLIK